MLQKIWAFWDVTLCQEHPRKLTTSTINLPQKYLIMVLMNKLKPRYHNRHMARLYFKGMNLKTLSQNWLCKVMSIVPSRRIT